MVGALIVLFLEGVVLFIMSAVNRYLSGVGSSVVTGPDVGLWITLLSPPVAGIVLIDGIFTGK